MQAVPPRWEHLVLVCTNERPAGALKPSCGHQGGQALRAWLKDRLREEGLWDRVRVVTTGCLDVCSAGTVTVVIDGTRRVVLDAEAEREALLEALRALPDASPE